MSNPASPADVEATPAASAASPPSPSAAAPPATPPSGGNLFGMIALILAVLGFIVGVIPVASGFAWLLFVPAIVLAIIGLTRRGRPKRLAVAGLLVAIIGWVVAVIVTVVSVVVGINSVADGLDEIPDGPVNADGSVALGQSVTNDEGVTFTLDGVECGLTTTGSDFFDETPTGEFCRLDYTVANEGTESVSRLAADVTARSGTITYEADDATGLFGEDYFTTDVNPGLAVPCIVFVDVPAGTTLDTIVFAPVLSFSEPVSSATS